jgi:FixJ family two-component response regulator
MTGIELQRELLNLGINIPTIVITAVDDDRVAESAGSLGAVGFLTKPLILDALMAAIKAAAEKRH